MAPNRPFPSTNLRMAGVEGLFLWVFWSLKHVKLWYWWFSKLCLKLRPIQGFWECLSGLDNSQTPFLSGLSIQQFSHGLMASMHCNCRVALKSKDKGNVREYLFYLLIKQSSCGYNNCSHSIRLRLEEKTLFWFFCQRSFSKLVFWRLTVFAAKNLTPLP